jgi:hypothetical protein
MGLSGPRGTGQRAICRSPCRVFHTARLDGTLLPAPHFTTGNWTVNSSTSTGGCTTGPTGTCSVSKASIPKRVGGVLRGHIGESRLAELQRHRQYRSGWRQQRDDHIGGQAVADTFVTAALPTSREEIEKY